MTAIQPETVWFNEIKLSNGEEVSLSYPANHTQGKRAVGGKLFVTNLRIAFAPNRLDAKMGGNTWEVAHADFASADTVKPQLRISEIFSGALRTRLAIHTGHSEVQCFVVRKPELAAREINTAIHGQAEGGGGPAAPCAEST